MICCTQHVLWAMRVPTCLHIRVPTRMCNTYVQHVHTCCTYVLFAHSSTSVLQLVAHTSIIHQYHTASHPNIIDKYTSIIHTYTSIIHTYTSIIGVLHIWYYRYGVHTYTHTSIIDTYTIIIHTYTSIFDTYTIIIGVLHTQQVCLDTV